MLDPAIARRLATAGQRIVITGASGWLGLATLDSLHAALGDAFDERVVALGSSARTLSLRDGTLIAQRSLTELADLPPAPTWLLHFAFLTKDRAETMDEAAYCAANAAIRETVLRALDPIGVDALFVASSGAAQKAEDPGASPAMRLYGSLKRDDEARFAQWSEASGKRAVIGRIFNLTGPYINKHQAYALASFILDGLAGRPITVRAPRPVLRGYAAIDDVVALALAEMAAAPAGVRRFDTGGEPLELGQVAQAVAAQCPGTRVDRAVLSEAEADVYHGDDAAWRALLQRHGIRPRPLGEQIANTIDYLRAGQ